MPDALKTEAICLEVVRSNGYYLQDVPENMRTEEICLAALSSSRSSKRNVMQYVPEAIQSKVALTVFPQLYAVGIRPEMGLDYEQLSVLSDGFNSGLSESHIRELANHQELTVDEMLNEILRSIPPEQKQPDFDWDFDWEE